jgi:pyrroloquinoline-quinone synthase
MAHALMNASLMPPPNLDSIGIQSSIHSDAKYLTIAFASPQWQESLYFKFLKTASRSELLRSQIPFFHAVEAFPRMLCKLAAMVKTSEARLLLVENIWEEHGSGKGGQAFHTSTFKTHLNALGWTGPCLERCPFLDDWICRLLGSDSPQELFLSLAAIEYLYAVVSETITDTLGRHDLLCEQHHYEKHSELDWEHGKELIEAMVQAGYEFEENIFDQAQKDFLAVFDSLAFPTVQEMIELRKSQPVAFYHTREDQGVLDEALQVMHDVRSKGFVSLGDLSVLLTCSGGEHVIHCLTKTGTISAITALDVNPEQIRVCQEKLRAMEGSFDLNLSGNCVDVRDGVNPLSCQQQAALGRFEFLFAWIREYLGRLGVRTTPVAAGGQSNDWVCSVTDAHLEYIVGRVLSNEILEAVFTEDATMYTTASFANHFVNVLRSLLQELDHSPMARNIFLGVPMPTPPGIVNVLKQDEVPVKYMCSSIQDFDFKFGYDLIDLSNVGDWLPLQGFRNIVQRAVAALAPGGALILRRLLGDYDIVTDVLNVLGGTEGRSLCTIRQTEDATHFYSQTVIAVKSPFAELQARL